MNEIVSIASAAFIAGLMGSAHCVGMCGGLSGLFATHQAARSTSSSVGRALAYNVGRITSYAILGFAGALLGAGLVDAAPSLVLPMRIFAGVLVILIGLQVAFGLRWLGILERAGSAVWSLVSPLARSLLPADTAGKSAGLGMLWGLLPCGMVYSVMMLAISTAEPVLGAIAMLAFGIGTTPAMLVTGLSAFRLSGMLRKRRVAAGGFLVAVGMLTGAVPAVNALPSDDGHAHHHGHHHHAVMEHPSDSE